MAQPQAHFDETRILIGRVDQGDGDHDRCINAVGNRGPGYEGSLPPSHYGPAVIESRFAEQRHVHPAVIESAAAPQHPNPLVLYVPHEAQPGREIIVVMGPRETPRPEALRQAVSVWILPEGSDWISKRSPPWSVKFSLTDHTSCTNASRFRLEISGAAGATTWKKVA